MEDGAGITLVIPGCSKASGGVATDGSSLGEGSDGGRLRRSGSERIKDQAKALLRRVEAFGGFFGAFGSAN